MTTPAWAAALLAIVTSCNADDRAGLKAVRSSGGGA
jgi:hypothetical protein